MKFDFDETFALQGERLVDRYSLKVDVASYGEMTVVCVTDHNGQVITEEMVEYWDLPELLNHLGDALVDPNLRIDAPHR